MPSISYNTSKLKYTLLLSISIAFVAGGVSLISRGSPQDVNMGWKTIALFGAATLLFAWRLIDDRPRIVVNDEGVLDCTLGFGIIPWTEITGAYIKSVRRMTCICLQLRDPKKWVAKLPPLKRATASANRVLGLTEINLDLSGVAVNSKQLLKLILEKSAEQTEGNGRFFKSSSELVDAKV